MKKIKLLMLLFALSFGKLYAQTGTINGLCVLVDFQDQKFRSSLDSVSTMFNQNSGYTYWGQTNSVKSYFQIQSNNKLTINTRVIKVAIPRTYAYYKVDKPNVDENQEFVKDVINAVNTAYPAGFTNLTVHPTQNRLQHFLILKQVNEEGELALDITPGLTIKNNGVNLAVRSVGTASWFSNNDPKISNVCRVIGKSLLGFKDYNRTNFSNLGNFCLMGNVGLNDSPFPINPALRYLKGWANNVIEISVLKKVYSTQSLYNYNTLFKYTNPSNSKEYLIIHPYLVDGFHRNIVDGLWMGEGLAIFYVNEDGDANNVGVPLIKLVQADNLDEMHNPLSINKNGAEGDFFLNSTPESKALYFKWKNGGDFGLQLDQISINSSTVSFRTLGDDKANSERAYFYHSISTDGNGTVRVPWLGVGIIDSSSTRNFTAIPDSGYEVHQIKVNGQFETLENSPLLTIRPTADGKSRFLELGEFEIEKADRNYIIEVSFRKKVVCSDPLWNATTAYSGGAKVSYNGKKYTAQWWTRGNQPDLNTGAGKPWVDNGVCGGTSNVAPTVSITSPITGTSFNQPASITINATATDADGSISKIEFYNGTTLFNTDVTAPYSFNWTNVAIGNYSITAKAYDNLGLVTTSSSVLVTVNSGNNTCTVPTWNATTAYSAGASVVYNGIRYTANWWNQNQRPDLNNAPVGLGKPWSSNGNCSARIAGAEPLNNQVEIYPNPSNGSFVVNTLTAGELEIKNAFGLTVFTTSLIEGKNVVETTLASGVYFVVVNQQVYKLVIE